jgi:2,3-bisphosphoglycerate-independent phosphoglycerate mutase
MKDHENEYLVCITGDHTTPVDIGDHTYQPVPLSLTLVSNLQQRLDLKQHGSLMDKVEKIDEIESNQGDLGRFPSTEIMPLLKKTRDWVMK